MLVALGMLCFFSMSLTGVENDKELLKVLQERPEIPFTPHEAEETVPRFPSIPADATDAETDQDRSLLRKTQELLSIDNVEEQQLEWLEKQLCLSDLLLQPADYKLLVEDAPAELATLIRALMQQSKQLKQQQQQATGRSRVLALLQQDLLTAAEIILIYRTLLGLNKQLSEEQLQRLQDILEIAGKRFREEWGIGISSTRYFPDVKDQQLYTRLVSVTALALEDVLKLFSIQHIEGNEKEKTQQKLSWQLTTTRLELERLLEEAKLPQQIADAFRVD
ncbi:hypothetical protein, conserved [Eimeria praecox]|uniref:Uncharacterized protein n=1 Tax=Eimeria praecox TaxID=51316 RepID=U6G5T5_9EIME|nr:hypothetical protein, conserved [Eimeria praecox]